jgi:hypothetical protein
MLRRIKPSATIKTKDWRPTDSTIAQNGGTKEISQGRC